MGRTYSPVVDGSLLVELATGTVRKARADEAVAVLTYPIVDAEGDFIQPDGGDWSKYPANPKVDWLHGIPVGRGSVELKALKIDGQEWKLPVGTTRFFRTDADLAGIDLRIHDQHGAPTNKSFARGECVHAAAQAKQLVLADLATGVSIELNPHESGRSVLGKSLLRGRPAYHFKSWDGLGWAHTMPGAQVNPGAQTVAKALELGRSGKLPDGTAMLPTIRKAFDSLLAANPKPKSVVGGFVEKSMDYQPEPAMTDEPPPPDDMATQDTGPPTAKAAYDAAQGCTDLATAIRDAVKASEHLKGKAKLLKLADELESVAEDASAVGDMVTSDVGGDDGDPETTDDSDEEPADESGADDADDPDDKPEKKKTEKAFVVKPIQKADDGRLITATGYAPRRFRYADLKPVEKADPTPDADPELETELAREFRQLSRSIRPARRSTR